MRIPLPVHDALCRINLGLPLSEQLSREAVHAVFDIKKDVVRTALLAAILSGLMAKKPSEDEIVGILKGALERDAVFRNPKLRIPLPHGAPVIGYSSSGKKGFKTINISTPAAIVASCCGVYIAKGCSKATSSVSGSFDFLSMLGYNHDISFEKKKRQMQELGISFFNMEAETPRFAKIYEKRFFLPHALSFALAGLSFPVHIDTMVFGFSHPGVGLSAKVFRRFGYKSVFTVSSTSDDISFLDEIGVCGHVNIATINGGRLRVSRYRAEELFNFSAKYLPQDIGQMKTPRHNVQAALGAMLGKGQPAQRAVIAANTALLLVASGKASSLRSAYKTANSVICSGAVLGKLRGLVEFSGGNTSLLNKCLNKI